MRSCALLIQRRGPSLRDWRSSADPTSPRGSAGLTKSPVKYASLGMNEPVGGSRYRTHSAQIPNRGSFDFAQEDGAPIIFSAHGWPSISGGMSQ